MNRKWRIPPVHRSLVGQTTVLSLALLLLALGYFVFMPVMTMDLPDPKQRTLTLASISVFEALSDPEKPLSSIEDTEALREVAAANAQFRLYVRRGAEKVQIGAPPRWEGALDYSELWSSQEASAVDGNGPIGPYPYVSFSFSEENALGISRYRLVEGQEIYFEIGGIQAPIQQATERLAFWEPEFFWNWTQDYLAVGGAVLAGVLFLLFLLVRSMRRLARVAQSLDPQAPSHRLPEKGLPTEIVPMVRAINRMIRRIDRANEEQAFFLAAAAHELRTPLTIVRTRLENLPEGSGQGGTEERSPPDVPAGGSAVAADERAQQGQTVGNRRSGFHRQERCFRTGAAGDRQGRGDRSGRERPAGGGERRRTAAQGGAVQPGG